MHIDRQPITELPGDSGGQVVAHQSFYTRTVFHMVGGELVAEGKKGLRI